MAEGNGKLVTTMEQLEGMYGEVYPPARVKEIDHVNADYRVFQFDRVDPQLFSQVLQNLLFVQH